MQKISPKKNTLDNDFLNALGGTVSKANEPEPKEEIVTNTFSVEDDKESEEPVLLQKVVKDTQIVVRTTEKEKREIQSYFMKHGLSISKGIKLAIKYLEQQEKKNLVHFSDVGLY